MRVWIVCLLVVSGFVLGALTTQADSPVEVDDAVPEAPKIRHADPEMKEKISEMLNKRSKDDSVPHTTLEEQRAKRDEMRAKRKERRKQRQKDRDSETKQPPKKKKSKKKSKKKGGKKSKSKIPKKYRKDKKDVEIYCDICQRMITDIATSARKLSGKSEERFYSSNTQGRLDSSGKRNVKAADKKDANLIPDSIIFEAMDTVNCVKEYGKSSFGTMTDPKTGRTHLISNDELNKGGSFSGSLNFGGNTGKNPNGGTKYEHMCAEIIQTHEDDLIESIRNNNSEDWVNFCAKYVSGKHCYRATKFPKDIFPELVIDEKAEDETDDDNKDDEGEQKPADTEAEGSDGGKNDEEDGEKAKKSEL